MLCSALMAAQLLQGCSIPITDKNKDFVARVANGTRITNDVWADERDFVVELITNYGQTFCTGIAAHNVVLTAEHCVRKKHISTFKIRSAKDAGIFNVINVVKHPEFDVALLWINAPVSSSKPMYLSDRVLETGDALAITGFGRTENTAAVGKLFETPYGDIEIVECSKTADCSMGTPKWWCNSAHIACAASGPSSIIASCKGDSGGPWWRRSSTNHDSIYVVGVNSFAIDRINYQTGGCGDASKKTGFVRTSAIKSWVLTRTDKFRWANEDTPTPTAPAGPHTGVAVAHVTITHAPTPTPHTAGVCRHDGVIAPRTLAQLELTQHECITWCQEHRDCIAFSWRTNLAPTQSGMCWFKRAFAQSDLIAISGWDTVQVKGCQTTPTRFPTSVPVADAPTPMPPTRFPTRPAWIRWGIDDEEDNE